MKSPAAKNPEYAIPDFFTNPVLRPYLRNVLNWQGYIRFLGLPDRRDNPDIVIDRLFVAPLLTRRYVSPEENPEVWLPEAEPVLDVLAGHTPLVILGDPGSGKSTLLNMVAWMLSRPATNALIEKLGWRLPMPMVLRDLPVRGVSDFNGLLEVFLSQDLSRPLRNDRGQRYLKQMLAGGRAFLLLDGIDEIGDQRSREDLREAVFDGISRFPNCRWLLSSRIVGYDEVRFDLQRGRPDENRSRFRLHGQVLEEVNPSYRHEWRSSLPGLSEDQIPTRYIAPFDDSRVTSFAHNWYRERDAASQRAVTNANHLIRAVHADESILRLARVPNLLTMMALIHRIEATLPHGRALLYERIAEAYLESIDKYRGISTSPHDLPRKKSWLARVGFEMQRLRTSGEHEDGRDMLVDYETVLAWLSEEMHRGDPFADGHSAPQFLRIVARRSGLFLPRGESRYAFVHLSFQEYFAAVALRREVTRLRWAKGEKSRFGFDRQMVEDWAGESIWRETFAFLFELLATEEEDDWYADLLECVFGKKFSRLDTSASDGVRFNLGQLLARLVVNSRSGLSSLMREQAIACCIRAQFRLYRPHVLRYGIRRTRHRYLKVPADIFAELVRDDPKLNERVFTQIAEQLETLEPGDRGISLWRSQISDLEPLASLTTLEWLDLEFTRVSDLLPLAKLTSLSWLNLVRTEVSDVDPLSNLTALKYLGLAFAPVSEIDPIGNLKELQQLDLAFTSVLRLEPLSMLTELKSLLLTGTQISDIRPIASLAELEELDLSRTRVSDTGPIASLTELQELDLSGTPISDIGPVASLVALGNLDISGTRVTDISPIANLTALEFLDLSDTQISDISPIANLTALEVLNLSDTQISDIAPIANMAGLEALNLSRTQVSDMAPIANLTSLKLLNLSETQVFDIGPISDLAALRQINLVSTTISFDVIKQLRASRPDLRVVFETPSEHWTA